MMTLTILCVQFSVRCPHQHRPSAVRGGPTWQEVMSLLNIVTLSCSCMMQPMSLKLHFCIFCLTCLGLIWYFSLEVFTDAHRWLYLCKMKRKFFLVTMVVSLIQSTCSVIKGLFINWGIWSSHSYNHNYVHFWGRHSPTEIVYKALSNLGITCLILNHKWGFHMWLKSQNVSLGLTQQIFN